MNIEVSRLHTTLRGEERIKRNLSLETNDVVAWCKEAVTTFSTDQSRVERRGKNWYVDCDDFLLTINAHSHTIITAHPRRPVV
ncbi:Protein of unknown function [Agreia bicolorata]|uniref:DUF3781 domain-containing protein n=1 Tax=Agreia bicolorata TaxID=110935 RepID=A0A1T4YG29_9MICO|nr:DUF3781 domain-containing protein [Agreia bicolorata]SKB00734.1 Protein of unknown function [Agreia bicolorata]